MHPKPPSTVAFVGLGAMGFGMASHLVKIGYQVVGFDVYEPTRARFKEAGGNISPSPRDAANGADFFICMVANSEQADSVLFGPDIGAVEGVHIAAASEAMGLAVRMGLDTRRVYDIIVNTTGNSWMFENRVPHMLDNDWTPRSALDIFGIVTSSARSQGFPLPLSSVAEQLYLSASWRGYGKEDDSGLVRLFTQSGSAVHDQAKKGISDDELTPTVTPNEINKVGFIGLGAMGMGMATCLVKAGFKVSGYDISPGRTSEFLSSGGNTGAESPAEAALQADILILMIQTASQVEDVLFGSGKAAEKLPTGGVVILHSTVPPSFTRKLHTRLQGLGKEIYLVDAPISGGVTEAADGLLTIICSASRNAMSKANPVLVALSGKSENIFYVGDDVGAASSIMLIKQLLAGVHIMAAAEAMAFGAKLGLDTRSLYGILKNAAGGSWMFEDRVPAMLSADWVPHSSLAIFVNDLGTVLDEAKRLSFPAALTAAVHQMNLIGASYGWAQEADSGIVRFWELITGVCVSKSAELAKPQEMAFKPREYPRLSLKETIDSLPPTYKGDILRTIRERISDQKTPLLVILDDDPTGTQTCHDIAVLTVWDRDTLQNEMESSERGFFILTNSRALPPAEAKKLIETICKNVEYAARTAGKEFEIVLRGDSTLRGHFPDEPETVEATLGKGDTDAWILAPFFYQGGRYTIEDVHYIAEGDELVPVGQTQFAQDATFGYESSNLRDYVLEKAGSRFTSDDLFSISLDDIRRGPEIVTEKLLTAPKRSVIIVNAAAESDMFVFAAGILAAEQQGRKYLYRTGAAFVSSRLGISGIPPLSADALNMSSTTAGGLIIAGSYVQKTTLQLRALRSRRASKLHVIELPVAKMIHSSAEAEKVVNEAIVDACQKLKTGHDVLVMTSRDLVVGEDAISSLSIGGLIAASLVNVMRNIDVRPRYIIAKGGITSSDIATKGLNMKRAIVIGQALPGVPLWRCDEKTSRHQGVPYVVFPGNVGGEDTLAELVEEWAISEPS
ncbi:L-threonate dehydrogenase [Hyphodiscus hymeniophilus]|uniref:L-threonate dehydrogenase n=1 Tax=Hyphodiscus hymeniophilus TaxID=353542 RepID=A0A9P7AYT0_9HELO|nr:L-threonate dehydrogenase [Hyphodiscus hymeniophilus]